MKLIDWVFPLSCVGCRKWGMWLCEGCRAKLKWAEPKCPGCTQNSVNGVRHERCKEGVMEGLWSVYEYEDLMQKIIKTIKYRFCRDLVGVVLAGLELDLPGADLVVPIPLHWYRENWRGFNQAQVLAEELGQRWGLSVERVLERKKATKPVAEMKAEEREKVVEGIFKSVGEVKGKRIVLVDDVFTTGATMREAAKVLKQAGVESVWGFVLAS